MPIKMTCASCGKTLSAPDTAAGKKAKCPSCGQIMLVPEAVHEAEDVYASSADPYAVSSEPAAGAAENWLDEMQPSAASPAASGSGGEQRRPCPECGEMIVAGAAKCRFCNAILDPQLRKTIGTSQTIPNYLVQAILTTVCCGCLPFGIVAIVYAAQVNGRLQAGDMRGAKSASDSAKMWCWVSFGLGVAWVIIYVIFMATFGATAVHHGR
jgi:predicted RNA-binding Zn-ribbon protein involved in translation (DUF1610 family)